MTDQLSLFHPPPDPPRPKAAHNGSPGSIAGAAAAEGSLGRQEGLILAYVARQPQGATSGAIEAGTGFPANVVSARVNRLKERGLLVPEGERPNAPKSKVIVPVLWATVKGQALARSQSQ